MDFAAVAQALERDGVVHIPQALSAEALTIAQSIYDWEMAHPGPLSSRFRQTQSSTFYHDLYNPDFLQACKGSLSELPVGPLLQSIWQGSPVWFMYEQVFLKEGGETRRTPWHQDSSYLAIGGSHLAVVWITFDSCTRERSLEFVRGSHKGVLYNGSRFELGDDTAPTHPDSPLPRLPDIEANRDSYDIISFANEPGDLVIFHPATLHGGGGTIPGKRRRTLTLRYFGDNAVYEPRVGGAGPRLKGFHERMAAGQPFRDEAFLQVA